MSKVAEAEVCGHCGQPIGSGIGGEYPCPRCGTPTLHDPAPTPEERADHALGEVSLDDEERGFATGRVGDAIREAVAEEREACAVLLEKLAPAYGRFDRNITEALKDAAREIRARSKS